MKDLISVVVPIYNVAPYLEKCIDSILNQTYKNMEIILVDDGSTDGGAQICDDYAGKYDKIKVIHQENSKLTVTRRNGVNLAQGEYVGFVDGDDWIEPNMYEVLYNYIHNEKVDIATSRICRQYEWGRGDKTLGDSVPTGKYEINRDSKYILKSIFPGIQNGEGSINGSLCNKLFRIEIIRKVLNDIDYHVHGYMDDNVCTVGAIIKSNSIFVSSDILYHHRERSDSFTYSKNSTGLIQINYGYLALKKIVEKSIYSEELLPDLIKYVSNSFVDAYNNLFETNVYTIPRYLFKSRKIPVGSKVLLYGAGKVCQSFWRQLTSEEKYELLGIIDGNEKKYININFVHGIKDIHHFKYDFIIIAVKDKTTADEIKMQLMNEGVLNEQIVWEFPLSIFEYYK